MRLESSQAGLDGTRTDGVLSNRVVSMLAIVAPVALTLGPHGCVVSQERIGGMAELA